jgi:iron donor protein CyaY
MDDQEFQTRAGTALEDLNQRLGAASEEYAFDHDFNSGALSVEFEDAPAKFVVSPNAPVRQLWVSAHFKSYKLDWDASKNAFVLPSTGQTLAELMAEAIGKQLGEEVTL